MAKMAQQVLLSPPEKTNVMLLAVARQESQAEVVRTLIAASQQILLKSNGVAIAELLEAFEVMKVEPFEALTEMLAVKLRADGIRRPLTLADLRLTDGSWRKRFPRGTGTSAE